jgi:putative NADH-flavin reductase
MKMVVFGATGGTGQMVVAKALADGWDVTAFTRNPSKLTLSHENLRVATGDVSDGPSVAGAVPGHDVVVSTLGVGIPLKHDEAVIAGIRHIVQAMVDSTVRRMIYQSFIGVPESRVAAGPILRYVARFPLRHEIADHVVKEEIVASSPLSWTIVRPPKLTNGPGTDAYRAGEHILARTVFPTLSRADVADFIVREAGEGIFARRKVRLLPGGRVRE